MSRALLARYHRLPQKVRLVLTTIIGLLVGLVTYEIFYALNPFEPRATIAWAASFVVGITRQHSFHRLLTFTHSTPYWSSLYRAYIMYSGALVWGCCLSWVLTEQLGLDHQISWVCCLVSTGIFNLVLLERFVFAAKSK